MPRTHACQEEANVVHALQGKHNPSQLPTLLAQQSINLCQDKAFDANLARAYHDVGIAGERRGDGLGEGGGKEGTCVDAGVGAGVGAGAGGGEGGDGAFQVAGEDVGEGTV